MIANFSAASFAWGLEAMAGLHRIPFDAALVLSQFPPPHTVESFAEAAQALGLRTSYGELVVGSRSAIGCRIKTIFAPTNGEKNLL